MVLAHGKAPCDELGDAQPVLDVCMLKASIVAEGKHHRQPTLILPQVWKSRPPAREVRLLQRDTDLLKRYTDAKVEYATRRLEAENVALAARGAAVQARCEEEVEELQARHDEEVENMQTHHEKEIIGIQAELAKAKANARQRRS
ncbi:hypothetical protein QYE76_066407 [Lolium multiflorum]|uniref:Uncharacterized protein n=1 Tax=Lolium multiflorum TaxID=4521 RepID=A0AAD8WC29_LOLMU|nr:hypothetical protein QYE76_066407 [Lolium multiflorum]